MRIISKKRVRQQPPAPQVTEGGSRTTKTVALFGGAFNPPHRGHVAMVKVLLRNPAIDAIWILPVYRHPFAKPMLPFEQRLAMSRLAFAGLSPAVKVRPLEKRLGGRGYTITLLKYLKKLYPRIEFQLVMGADSYRERDQWHDMAGIQHLVDLIVFPRGARSKIPNISSTQLRRALSAGKDVRQWVPAKVAQYIKRKQLYT